MPKLFLRHTKTNKRFEIVRRDRETNTVTLKGEHATFDEPFDPKKFKEQGYILEQVEE